MTQNQLYYVSLQCVSVTVYVRARADSDAIQVSCVLAYLQLTLAEALLLAAKCVAHLTYSFFITEVPPCSACHGVVWLTCELQIMHLLFLLSY